MLIDKAIDENCEKHFIKSILVYVKKPQLVNKKLSHSKNVVILKIRDYVSQNQIIKILEKLSSVERDNLIQSLEEYVVDKEVDIDLKQIEDSEHGKYLIVNRLEPRDVRKFQSRFIGIVVGESLMWVGGGPDF